MKQMWHTTIIILFCLFSGPIFAVDEGELIEICDALQLVKISDNAYVHISYMPENKSVSCNGMILVDKGKAFLFDTPPSDSVTEILVAYIKNEMKLHIEGFVCNDWHRDSMLGLGTVLKAGIPTYANEMTREIAKEKKLPVPETGFRDSLALRLGNKEILCYYFGPAHTMDNIVVWIPSEKVLFANCMVKEMKAGNLGFTDEGDVKAYASTLLKVREKFPDVLWVIPGHGDYGGPELIDHTLKMARAIK